MTFSMYLQTTAIPQSWSVRFAKDLSLIIPALLTRISAYTRMKKKNKFHVLSFLKSKPSLHILCLPTRPKLSMAVLTTLSPSSTESDTGKKDAGG